jgi:ribosome-binding factor A
MKRELSAILRELKDPRVHGMLSIVRLELSNDLSHCKVYVSAVEGMETAKEAVEGLKSASGFIKKELSVRVKMRRLPELHFVADDSIEHSAQLNKLMDDLSKKQSKHEGE